MAHDPLDRIATSVEKLVRLKEREADTQIERKFDRILTLLGESKEREIKMALDLTRLEEEVGQNTSVIGSAVALLGGIGTRIDELIAQMATPEDKAKLQAFADQLDASEQALAAAVAAHTPADPNA